MNDINKTIKHFKSLQKRYTSQHNGQMCERVDDALEALERFKYQEDYFTRMFGNHQGVYVYESYSGSDWDGYN